MRAMVRSAVILAACVLTAAPAIADGAYVRRDQIDLVRILPPPPAPDSDAQKADIAAVLKAQEERTDAAAERAKADAELSVFRFADVVGPDFKPENLPVTTAFFDKVKADSGDLVEPVKAHWNRPRPSMADASIHPALGLPKNASYPSGHTAFGRLNAIVLAAMLPEKRAEIFARGDEYGANRIVGGVHFPTDVAGGKIAGTVIAQLELQNPAFVADFEAAKAELRAALKLNQTH